ncbi:hypothetical protein BURMUCGD1_4324 [Burkholderia multivorans CGD1]|nr:hypothetical protein BURMUCGD1_4324 [Burkholderia multivorans CGD1]
MARAASLSGRAAGQRNGAGARRRVHRSTIRHTKRVARRLGNADAMPAAARGFFAPVRA